MAQRVTFTYKHVDSTEALNRHIAGVIAPGVYQGLLVSQTDPASLHLNISPGYALTTEGVKIEESIAIGSALEALAGHPTRRRVDLVCLYHKYIAGPTEPSGNPASYVLVKGEVPNDDITEPVAPYDKLTEHHIVLAEIHTVPGVNYITQQMIFNTRRVPTTDVLDDLVAESMFYALGNFSREGWDVIESDVTNVLVTPGKGLLAGRLNVSYEDYVISSIRFAEYLRPPFDTSTGEPAKVGQNLTLLEQPDFPTKLAIEITSTSAAVSGKIYISGKDESGEHILGYALSIGQAAETTKTYYTSVVFSEVFLEGIDAHELIDTNNDVFISIRDMPVNHIIVVGTVSGVAQFKNELRSNYELLNNEMLLARVYTDADSIIEVERLDTRPQFGGAAPALPEEPEEPEFTEHWHNEFSDFVQIMPSGSDVFAGAGAFREIELEHEQASYIILLATKRQAGAQQANIGEVWYERITGKRFRVYNSGTNNTAEFTWMALSQSILANDAQLPVINNHIHEEFFELASKMPFGLETLAGQSAYREITLSAPKPGFRVLLSLNKQGQNKTANAGELYYETVNDSTFRVYNTGENNTDSFVWAVLHQDEYVNQVLPVASDHTHNEFDQLARKYETGTETLAGRSAYREITLSEPKPGFKVLLSLNKQGDNEIANVGELYYEVISSTSFRVYNTGENSTDSFTWLVV